MADEFVKKEVFDARMDRMEALLEKTLIEMQSEIGQLRSDVKAESGALRSEVNEKVGTLQGEMEQLRSDVNEKFGTFQAEIRVLDTKISSLDIRIDSVQTTVYWGFALMGLFVAVLGFFITFAPSIWGMLRKRNRSTVSRKEVENIVNASFDRYLAQTLSLQGK